MSARRTTLIGLGLAATLSLLVAACGSSTTSDDTTATTARGGSTTTSGAPVTTFTDPAQPVAVAAGQAFDLSLESNATTGYQWQIAQPADPSVTTALGSSYIAPQTTLVGAPGRQLFNFQAKASGTTSVTLRYQRQTAAEDDLVVTYTITVS